MKSPRETILPRTSSVCIAYTRSKTGTKLDLPTPGRSSLHRCYWIMGGDSPERAAPCRLLSTTWSFTLRRCSGNGQEQILRLGESPDCCSFLQRQLPHCLGS